MPKLEKLAGATSEIWQIFIQDSTSTTGGGLTGLVNNSAGLTAYYHRDTDTTATAITLASMTVGTFTSSGFKEIDATNMPGWYQFCPPNAAIAASAKSCGFHLKGATNMAPLPIEVQLVAVNPDDAVKFGMTRVVANTDQLNGTALTGRDIGASVLLSTGTGTGQLDFTSGVVKANMTQILGTTTATPATAGILDVNTKNINNVAAATPGASGGILISGSNSGTTTLAALTVTGTTTHTGATVHTGNVSYVDGITVAAPSTGNRAGITVTGNGTGAGVSVTGGNGATGNGIDAIAASTNGHGITSTATGTGSGLKLVSISGDALLTSVSTSGHGATFAGTGTTKHGVNATGGATTSHGISATGGGVGHGILGTSGGGATGDGFKGVSAATNGNGLNLVGNGTGDGLLTTGGASAGGDGIQASAGGGVDIRGAITGNITGAVSGAVGSITGVTFPSNFSSLSISSGGRVQIQHDIQKNTARTAFPFLMTDSTTHAPKTGVTVTCTRSIDGGAFGAGTLANVTEVGVGIYTVDFGAGDLNGNTIVLRGTGSASDDMLYILTTAT